MKNICKFYKNVTFDIPIIKYQLWHLVSWSWYYMYFDVCYNKDDNFDFCCCCCFSLFIWGILALCLKNLLLFQNYTAMVYRRSIVQWISHAASNKGCGFDSALHLQMRLKSVWLVGVTLSLKTNQTMKSYQIGFREIYDF